MKKRMICMLLTIVMLVCLLPVTVLAATVTNVTVTNPEYYDSGALKSITANFNWGTNPPKGRLVLTTKYLRSEGSNGYALGDFSDQGYYAEYFNFLSFDDVLAHDKANGDLGIITYTEQKSISSSNNSMTFSFAENNIPLSKNATYYVYFWTYYEGQYYPDNLIMAIAVKDGAVTYTAANSDAGRNVLSGTSNQVTSSNTYDVTVIAAENMTKTDNSGAASQSELKSAMTPVVFTANDGYTFPENYAVATTNGIMVRRDNAEQITVFGTPTNNTTITLPAPTITGYRVSFDANGGTGTVPTQDATAQGGTFTIPDADGLTKDGYTFAGWNDGEKTYAAGDTYTMPAKNVTFTAQWSANQYSITQHPDTTNGTLFFQYLNNYYDNITSAKKYDEIAICYEPAEGYELVGDITAQTEEGEPVEVEFSNYWWRHYITMPAADVIVSATFEKVDYDIALADEYDGGEVTVDKETANFGDTVTITATPDAGYVVKSVTVTPVYSGPEPCSLEEEGEEPDEIAVTDNGDCTYSFTMPASNVAVDATFEVPMSAMQIFIQVSSDTPIALEVEPTDRIEDIKLKIQDKTGIAPEHQRLLYADKQMEDGNTLEDYSIQKDSTIILKIVYSVRFDTNGKASNPGVQWVIDGEKATAPTAPTVEGYTFGGWYTDENCTTEFEFSTAITVDTTLYAKWTEAVVSYNVWIGGQQFTSKKLSIEGDSGTATFAPESNTLTLNNFSHTSEGYKFNPWMGSASIYATLEHLTVNFVGSNTVACSAENGYALYNYGALTITTDDTNGSLALTGDGDGIWVSGNLIINGCQVNATGITSNGTIAITNSFVTANGARHGIAVVHAEEDDATEMKSDDLTITNSTVVATGGEYALFYDGGHNEDESSIRGGLIPKLAFDNEFAVVAGSDAESAVMAAADAAATYENKHVRIVSVHDVTYKVDGEVVKTLTVEHGKDATAPEIPAKTGYTAAWSADGKNITADTVINAVYSINKYTVTYKADGKVVKTVEVEHGKDATAPEIPAKEGYNETAPKWDKDGKNITADTEINAVYTKNQPGEYADVTPDTNVGGGKVAEEIEELKEKVPFTQEEEKQIEHGADVEVWLEIKDISDSVSSEDKAKVEEKLGDADVALYLDIVMFKQIGENEASRLTQLSDKVQITFQLPDSYINTDQNVTRTYSIIHVHDGKAEVITPVFDANAKTLSFQTDRFSTYALVYTDVVNTPPTEETVPPTEETVPPTEKPAPPVEIPATGDSFQPAFWIACMILSIFGIAVLLLDAKRRHAR